jgi:hypothetical protein
MIKKLDILSIDFDWITNARQQQELLTFIIPMLQNHSDITLALTHDKIYPLFGHGYDEYNLINIDHHHDFLYETYDLDESNWLYHLSNVFCNKINYTWVCNPNSQHYPIKKMKNLKSFNFDHNLSFIKQKTFDKIFLCCSPDYATCPEVSTSYKTIEKILINE